MSEDDGIQLADAKVLIAKLQQEVKQLRAAIPSSSTTSAPLTRVVGGRVVNELMYEEAILSAVIVLMLMLWMIPVLRPFRYCCETRLHKVYPAITIFNFICLAVTLNQLSSINFNDFFFGMVNAFELILKRTEQALIGVAALFAIGVVWKFKDRVFEVLGIENAAALFGDFRDWATCWSMKRFHPLEVFIWKVEGLPSARLHSPNDVFCEVSFGYNVVMKTRETLQLNFDPFDAERRLTLSIMSQEVVGSSELAKLQLGSEQVRRLEEPAEDLNRSVGWGSKADPAVWAPSNFQCWDLVPAGKVYLRFMPVPEESRNWWDTLMRTTQSQ